MGPTEGCGSPWDRAHRGQRDLAVVFGGIRVVTTRQQRCHCDYEAATLSLRPSACGGGRFACEARGRPCRGARAKCKLWVYLNHQEASRKERQRPRSLRDLLAIIPPPPFVPPPPCNSYALVQATVGVGTVLIWYLILIRYKCSAAA